MQRETLFFLPRRKDLQYRRTRKMRSCAQKRIDYASYVKNYSLILFSFIVEGKMYLHDETFVLPRRDICTITMVYSPCQS